MMRIRLNDGLIAHTDSQIRAAHPEWSCPLVIDDDLAQLLGWATVQEIPPPTYDPDTHRLVELPPVEVEGVWTQQWQVIALTEEELTERLQANRQRMVVTPLQATAALLQADLLDEIETMISDPATDPLAKLAWSRASEFRRTSPTVLGMAQAMGWTEQQLDDLFTLAATLDA